MRISDWSSDVCSSDLISCHKRDAEIDEHRLGDRPEADVDDAAFEAEERRQDREEKPGIDAEEEDLKDRIERDERSDILIVALCELVPHDHHRSEEHTSELQSLMRISYAVFCLKKKKNKTRPINSDPNLKS